MINMNWKSILKAQRSLIDFGLEPKSSNLAGMQRDEQMNKEIAEMRNKLQQNVGRIKSQVNQKTVDLATHRLNQLKEIESMGFPENIEAFKQLKQEYKVNL